MGSPLSLVQKPVTVYVVILSEAKNLFVAGKNETFAEFILSEAEGLRVTGLEYSE